MPTFSRLANPPLSAVLLVLVLLGAVVGGCAHFAFQRPLINDEAVELIQGTGMPLDRFHFFAPEPCYPDGIADVIETAVPYFQRMLTGEITSPADQPRHEFIVRAFYLAAYITGACLLALTAGRLWAYPWSPIAGLLLIFSSYCLILNNIVTRNGITILWSTLAAWSLILWLNRRPEASAARNALGLILLTITLILGCWTYTSFRILTVAIYGALSLHWLRYERTKTSLLAITLSAVGFATVIALMVTADETELEFFIKRGSYALRDPYDYIARLGYTLLSPWHHASSNSVPFLVEDVHILVGRAVISPWLSPFFALGWVLAWRGSCRYVHLCALVWTLGMIGCALAGPNTKYLFVFLPFTLLLTLSGLRATVEFLNARIFSKNETHAGLALLLILVFTGEIRDFTGRFIGSERHKLNAGGDTLAAEALTYYRKHKTRVYVHTGLGFDIVKWRTRHYRHETNFTVHISLHNLRETMTENPPPEGSVLFISYPAKEIPPNSDGWFPPASVRIITTN